MGFENISGQEQLPEEMLAVASAIAERSMRLATVTAIVQAKIYGVPFEPQPVEDQLEKQKLVTANMLLIVQNPSDVVSFVDSIAATKPANYYTKTAGKISDRINSEDDDLVITVDPNAVKAVEETSAELFQENTGITDEYITEEFSKQYRACKEIAEKYSVDLVTVYENDELFSEAKRSVDDPEASMTDVVRAVNGISEELMNSIVLRTLDNMIPVELKDMLGEEELEEMALDMQIDPAFQEILRQQVEMAQECVRQIAFYDFVMTYGIDAINSLSQELKDVVLPQEPLTSIVAELVQSQE